MSVDKFAILAPVGTFPGITMRLRTEIFWDPSMCGPTLGSDQVPHRALSPVSNPPWRNTLRDTFNLRSFFVYAKSSILGPHFQLLPGVHSQVHIFEHTPRWDLNSSLVSTENSYVLSPMS